MATLGEYRSDVGAAFASMNATGFKPTLGVGSMADVASSNVVVVTAGLRRNRRYSRLAPQSWSTHSAFPEPAAMEATLSPPPSPPGRASCTAVSPAA